jgi:hypothetical protein
MAISSPVRAGESDRISFPGGAPSPVTERAQGEWFQGWPQILPGGKAVLFTSVTGTDDASIQVVSLKDRRKKTLQRSGTFGRYLPSGHLVYVNNGTCLRWLSTWTPWRCAACLCSCRRRFLTTQYPAWTARFFGEGLRAGNAPVPERRSSGGEVTVEWLDRRARLNRCWRNPAAMRIHACRRPVNAWR